MSGSIRLFVSVPLAAVAAVAATPAQAHDLGGLLIGPEAGLPDAELDLPRLCPFLTPVGRGSRILRAGTATLTGLALLQASRRDGILPP